MQITDLGLTPSLQESLPPSIEAKIDLAMMRRIDKKLRLKKKVTRRKKQLAKVLKKIDNACWSFVD